MAELERGKNIRENVEVEAGNLREEVDRLKGKVEEVRIEISVRPKNKAEEVEVGFLIGQIRLNNVRTRSEEGTGKQCEWIKVKAGRSKKVVSP